MTPMDDDVLIAEPTIITDATQLRDTSEAVTSYAEAREIIEMLVRTAMTLGGPDKVLGLAAPQLGIKKRVFIAWGSVGEGHAYAYNAYVNAEYMCAISDDRLLYTEGCLSLPGVHARTNRHSEIRISTLEDDEERHEYVLDGVDAVVFQHEYDHLFGILMTDFALSTETDMPLGMVHVGRNDPCPCGKMDARGRPIKFKKCCGK